MSGRKRITVDSADYEWLQQQSEQLRYIRADLPETIERNLRQQAADLQNQLVPLQQRQSQYESALSGMSAELRESELRAARELEQQGRAMRAALSEMETRHSDDIEDLRGETLNLLAAQDAQLRALVDTERRAREVQGQILAKEIRDLAGNLQANEHRKMQLANTQIADAQIILDSIRGKYRHEQFAPGQLAKLELSLSGAIGSLNNRMPEAALSTAQSAFNGLSDLRLELERLEREWLFWRSEAQASTRALLSEAARNRQVEGVNIKGQPIELEIEVDWWTDGKLSALEAELHQEMLRLDEGGQLTTSELRKVADVANPALYQKLQDILCEARLAVVSSQQRYSIADLVVQALEEQGFEVDGGLYQGQDMRNGYVARVVHLDGGEVVVSVTPDAKQQGKNVLEINSYDIEQVSESELRVRAEEINRSLREMDENLQTSLPQDLRQPPNPKIRRLEDVALDQTRQVKL